jgi:hypothetical protein
MKTKDLLEIIGGYKYFVLGQNDTVIIMLHDITACSEKVQMSLDMSDWNIVFIQSTHGMTLRMVRGMTPQVAMREGETTPAS